jgi:hypothetical protein
MSVHVVGADRFHMVARKLRGAADRKDLVREMRKGILDAMPVIKDAIKGRAHEFLPDHYAAELVPSLRMTTATTTTGDQVTVRMTVTAKGHGGHPRQIGGLEAGVVRHPVFGRTRALRRHAIHKATSQPNPWVSQRVKPRFVTEPATDKRPAVRQEIEAAVDRVLDKIARG